MIKAKLVEIWNIKSLNRDDFKIYASSTEDAVGKIKDRCLLKNKNFVWTFSGDDDILTYRGVKLYDDKQKVFDMYGVVSMKPFDKSNDIIYNTLYEDLKEYGVGEFSFFDGDELYCEYIYDDIGYENAFAIIRFYFGNDNKVKLIGFLGTSF